ncbi:hypothetical protein P7C70_g7081, partial [Phenoliferia sp. Uapishka_3]
MRDEDVIRGEKARKPAFALPAEEEGSVQEKNENRPNEWSESSESSEDERPVRKRRSPSWLLQGAWDTPGMQKDIDHVDEPSEDDPMEDSPANQNSSDDEEAPVEKPKRRVGRPRKEQVIEQESSSEEEPTPAQDVPVKRGRGRPRKE